MARNPSGCVRYPRNTRSGVSLLRALARQRQSFFYDMPGLLVGQLRFQVETMSQYQFDKREQEDYNQPCKADLEERANNFGMARFFIA